MRVFGWALWAEVESGSAHRCGCGCVGGGSFSPRRQRLPQGTPVTCECPPGQRGEWSHHQEGVLQPCGGRGCGISWSGFPSSGLWTRPAQHGCGARAGFGGAFHRCGIHAGGAYVGLTQLVGLGRAGHAENRVAGLGRRRVEHRSEQRTKCVPFLLQAGVGGAEVPCAHADPPAEELCTDSVVGARRPWPPEDPLEPTLVATEAPPSPERGRWEDVSSCTPPTQVWRWAVRPGVPVGTEQGAPSGVLGEAGPGGTPCSACSGACRPASPQMLGRLEAMVGPTVGAPRCLYPNCHTGDAPLCGDRDSAGPWVGASLGEPGRGGQHHLRAPRKRGR